MPAMQNLTYAMHTMGCKLNTYDTSWLQHHLDEAGFKQQALHQQPQVLLLNTCAVTEQAVVEACRWARKHKRQHPSTLMVLTGCAAQVDSQRLARSQGVDLVVGNSHKNQLAQIIIQNFKKTHFQPELKLGPTNTQPIFQSNIFKSTMQTPLPALPIKNQSPPHPLSSTKAGGFSTNVVGLEAHRTRAFVKIQDGCNSFCTFCIIPFARGKSKSLKIKDIIAQVRALHDQGVQEAVLTGVHIGDYCASEGSTFSASATPNDLALLVENLLEHTKIPRLRLSSLEPIELTPRLMQCFKNPRLCPHFHMSVQSANTKVLQLMKRKYTRAQVCTALETIAQQLPHAFVGLDVIAGFVGEGDAEFNDTYNTLAHLPWTQLHVFPYSPRQHTWAYNKPVLPEKTRRARAARLRQLGVERYDQQARQQVGSIKQALPLKRLSCATKKPTNLQAALPTLGAKALSRDYWSIEYINSSTKSSDAKPAKERLFQITSYNKGQSNQIGQLQGRLI